MPLPGHLSATNVPDLPFSWVPEFLQCNEVDIDMATLNIAKHRLFLRTRRSSAWVPTFSLFVCPSRSPRPKGTTLRDPGDPCLSCLRPKASAVVL